MIKRTIVSLVVIAISSGWIGISLAQQPPAPRGELRIVDKHPTNRYSIERHKVERLIEVNPDGTMAPHLATDWRWIDDNTLEMTLRQGVRFHNGEVLEAEHVKLSFDLHIERYHYLAKFRGKPARGALLGTKIEIQDSQTIRFVFAAYMPHPPSALGYPRIINRQFVQELNRIAAEKKQPRVRRLFSTLRRPGLWGTGPYKQVEGASKASAHTKQIVLEANLDYWNKARFPRVKRLVFNHTFSADQAMEAVKTNEAQVDIFVGVAPIDTLRVAQSFGAKVVKKSGV
jgi:peptide/nickel transport system substrate-binding protein